MTARRKNGRLVAPLPPSAVQHGRLSPAAPATRESTTQLRLLVRHIIQRAILDHAARKPDATTAEKKKALNNRKNASRLRSQLYAIGPEMRERVRLLSEAWSTSAGSMMLTTIGRAHVDSASFALGAGELFFELYDEHDIRHAAPLALVATGAEELHLAKLLRSLAWATEPGALSASRSMTRGDTTARLSPGDALRLAATLSQVGRNNIATALALEAQSRAAEKNKPVDFSSLLAAHPGESSPTPDSGDDPNSDAPFVGPAPSPPATLAGQRAASSPETSPDEDDENQDSPGEDAPQSTSERARVGDTHEGQNALAPPPRAQSTESRLSVVPIEDGARAGGEVVPMRNPYAAVEAERAREQAAVKEAARRADVEGKPYAGPPQPKPQTAAQSYQAMVTQMNGRKTTP